MSKARSKGTQGENFFLGHLRELFGKRVERAPLKGVLDYGDFVNVPWLHESKSTLKPLFQQWARTAEKKAGHAPWVIMWKGDLRATSGNGPYVLMPLMLYKALCETGGSCTHHGPSRDPQGQIEPFAGTAILAEEFISASFRNIPQIRVDL